MELVFATNNRHKIEEVRRLLKNNVRLLSLEDINCNEELPETGNTLEANASQKARYVYEKFGMSCFADDTGLEIEALNGRPGVYSARYACEEKPFDKLRVTSTEKNIKKVLEELKGIQNRKADFKTIISLIINNKQYLFEGIVNGTISTELKGNKGFGYDPIFIPLPSPGGDGCRQVGSATRGVRSFAEMSLEEKNKMSHRAVAVKKLTTFLRSI
ncbi:MAG: RdgB/HAM1 family non-canonical purine NTP pyrophosphatase [Bacteroidetes bacterium]|nr:MAG: RdgB/HAM1 family non-canonical purine NTP pyrophosphatase [Bacteroidota bacterium]